MNTTAVVGIAFGFLAGGFIVQWGRRKTLLLANSIVLVSSGISMVALFWLICVSRFFMGFGTGLIMTAAPKFILETVPMHVMDRGFGSSTNIAINLAILTNTLVAIGVPESDADLRTTNYWRIIYALPMPTSFLAIILFLVVHREDSLVYHVQQRHVNETMTLL